jgi:septal ring-binding cell division protein DamX
MVAVVGVILLASWILRAEPRRAAAPAPQAPPPAAAPAETLLAPIVSAPEELEAERPPEAPAPLAQRALRDAQRLAQRREAWSAQLAAQCKEDSVAALVAKADGSERLYLVPVTIAGRSCFRVLWGTYASAAEASAADIPPALRGAEKPRALAVAGILP